MNIFDATYCVFYNATQMLDESEQTSFDALCVFAANLQHNMEDFRYSHFSELLMEAKERYNFQINYLF